MSSLVIRQHEELVLIMLQKQHSAFLPPRNPTWARKQHNPAEMKVEKSNTVVCLLGRTSWPSPALLCIHFHVKLR